MEVRYIESSTLDRILAMAHNHAILFLSAMLSVSYQDAETIYNLLVK